jgi:hypothetical protein
LLAPVTTTRTANAAPLHSAGRTARGRPLRAIVTTETTKRTASATSPGTIVTVVVPNETSTPGWSRARMSVSAIATSSEATAGTRS